MQLNIRLTTDEANAVLTALGHFPFNQVAPLVENIRGQISAQHAAAAAAEEGQSDD